MLKRLCLPMSDAAALQNASRQGAELILSDESLVPDLEGDPADRLVRWALAQADRVLLLRSQRRQPLDRAAVAEAVRPVRLLTRNIDRLVADRAGMNDSEFLDRLLALIDSACQLGGAGKP